MIVSGRAGVVLMVVHGLAVIRVSKRHANASLHRREALHGNRQGE